MIWPLALLAYFLLNFVSVREYTAELLSFVKIQNGGRRHLGLLFRNPGPPTKSTSRPEHCVKI